MFNIKYLLESLLKLLSKCNLLFNCIFLILFFILLVSFKNQEKINELILLEMPDSLKNTSLGIEYQKLIDFNEAYEIDSIGIQARLVLNLSKNYSDSFIAEIYNYCANSLWFDNDIAGDKLEDNTYNSFKYYPSKDTILSLYRSSYNICKKNNLMNTYTFTDALFQLAECLEQDNQYFEAMKFRKEYLELMKVNRGNNERMTADALMWIGSNFETQKRLDSALFYYKQELKIRILLKDSYTVNYRTKEIEKLEKALIKKK